jgi:hypothetical protein
VAGGGPEEDAQRVVLRSVLADPGDRLAAAAMLWLRRWPRRHLVRAANTGFVGGWSLALLPWIIGCRTA